MGVQQSGAERQRRLRKVTMHEPSHPVGFGIKRLTGVVQRLQKDRNGECSGVDQKSFHGRAMFDRSRWRRRAANLAGMRVHSDICRRRLGLKLRLCISGLIHGLHLQLLLALLHAFLLLPRLLLLLRPPVKVEHGEVSLSARREACEW